MSYYISIFFVGLLIMFVPFAISFANSKSTPGLRFLCGALCALNATLVTFFVFMDSPTVLNILLYMTFILLSMDVALRKVPEDLDTDAV